MQIFTFRKGLTVIALSLLCGLCTENGDIGNSRKTFRENIRGRKVYHNLSGNIWSY